MTTYEESFVLTKPHRPWMRWLSRSGCGLLILLILAVCVWWHHSVQQRLDEALAELDRTDPGWRLEDIEAAREEIPEENNSARVVVAAAKLVPENWLSQDLDTLLSALEPVERLPTEAAQKLAGSLDKVRAAIEEARKLANLPQGRYSIAYQPGEPVRPLPHFEQIKAVLTLLRCEVYRHNHNGDAAAALKTCRSIVNAARSLGDEPFAFSQLLRNDGLLIARRSLERALAQGDPSLEELSAAQRLLKQEDGFSELPLIARGERAKLHQLYVAIESSSTTLDDLHVRWPDWYELIPASIKGELIRSDHSLMLEMTSRWINVTHLSELEQVKAAKQLYFDYLYKARYNLLCRILVPPFLVFDRDFHRKHAVIRCALVGLAVENYRQAHKRWPASLDKLGPDLLDIVPADPYDGQPLRYRRLDDGVVIYAVGEDGVDNGGNFNRKPCEKDVDFGFRLWDVSKRRQPPRPKPLAPNPR